jgi:methyl-accepting chemotaxis protein/hemoglobin-like flavoprotein
MMIALIFSMVGFSGIYAARELIDSRHKAWQAQEAVTLAQTSRRLLATILPLSLERTVTIALRNEGAADPDTLSAITAHREALSTSFTRLLSLLVQLDVPAVVATLDRLNQTREAMVGVRPGVDAALRVTREDRDPQVLSQFMAVSQALIDALNATTDAVDAAIPRSDAVLQRYLLLKRAAWTTRVAIGDASVHAQASLATGSGWSLVETIAAAEERARVRAAWSATTEAVADASAPVRAAHEKARLSNFEGEPAAVSRTVFDALSRERLPPFTVGELRQREAVEHMTLVDLAYAALDELIARADALADEANRSLMRDAATLSVETALVALSLVALFAGILRPIRTISTAMQALTAGDTTVDVPVRAYRNEFGPITAAMQVFKDNLIRTRQLEDEAEQVRQAADEQRRTGMRQLADSFEAAVGTIIGQVSVSATDLQATAQTLNGTAARTASQATSVAAAAEQAASNVGTVAAAAEELGSSVQEIGRQVQGSAELAKVAACEADQTGTLVEELRAAVSRIGDVAGLIAGIAGQTNLLALNATIEAARAGEAGRGFAVVASEVKALAEQTARATAEIAGQIAQVQSSTHHAAAAIGSITTRIREINDVASSIAAAVEQQGAATQEIVRNVGQAAAGTGEVTSNIAGVAEAAAGTGSASDAVLGAASALAQHAEHLTDEIGRFLAGVRVSYAISTAQVRLVRDSFAQVQPIAETAADLFYDRLFAIAPKVRTLFPDDMTAQKRKLMAMLALAVANLDRPEALTATARDLGQRHVAYGALEAHYEPVGAALLWTLEQGLGQNFTAEVREAWANAYGVITSLMQMAVTARAA